MVSDDMRARAVPRPPKVELVDTRFPPFNKVRRDPHRGSVFAMYIALDFVDITDAKPYLRGEELEEAVNLVIESARHSIRMALSQARDKVPGHP